MDGVKGPYPYSLRKNWLGREELTQSEVQAASTALATAQEFRNMNATVLHEIPSKCGTTGLLNADLTNVQLRCLQPLTFLNDQVINVTLTMLQRLPEAATVLVLPTFMWAQYEMDTKGQKVSASATDKLKRRIHKHMKLFNVRSAVVPCSLPLYVLHT
jgi:Ulp1 family protease